MKKTLNKDMLRQVINLVVIIVTLAVNGLANAIPFNGQTTGEISDRFEVYFVPAGYVFAIWGVIYLGLILFAIFQALPAQRENPRLRNVGYLFAGANLANTFWLFFWHYNLFVLSLATMLILLGLLIATYLRLEIGRASVPLAEKLCIHLPVSIYLGWISVATITNVTDVLYYLEWGGFGIAPQSWAVIMLAVAVVLATIMALTRRDVAFLLVFLWSFAGIAIGQSETALVAVSAWVAAFLTLLLVILALVNKPKKGEVVEAPLIEG
jgi:hypothetical protein